MITTTQTTKSLTTAELMSLYDRLTPENQMKARLKIDELLAEQRLECYLGSDQNGGEI